MISLSINLLQIRIFLSVLLRFSLVLFLLPVFRTHQVPTSVKAWSVWALSLMATPFIAPFVPPLPLEPLALVGMIFSELIYATFFALSMNIIFGAYHMAGQVMSFQMGLGVAEVIDPQTGIRDVLLSQWLQILATLFFFAIDGHLVVVRTFMESFRAVPVGSFLPTPNILQSVLLLSGRLFVIALKIAAPIMAAQLVLQAGFAVVTKFSPQIHILMVSFPITIGVGILFALLSLSEWAGFTANTLTELLKFFRAVGLP
ncbi:flagellar biosynthetic protein FliR [Desulfosoma caldarium]|uniref:Flagellar biosynthetic protein FliR n=1 Tax=Desulfosoma caldarium TaxID=610254 RepID=A0A3N1VGB7_9BACT|nr:flagellar biosynthetic protein FliR [Desulfosoma caldarium]ROR01886.1 flagellar biosynthetic protein FliR [Desulfosoma caldarium]